MQIGLLTNSLTHVGWDLEQIAAWASKNGISNLEVGPAVPLDESLFRRVQEKYNVRVVGLIYCRNFLSADEQEAGEHRRRLRERIEFAGRLGGLKVITSTGRSPGADITTGLKAGLEASVQFLREMLELAAEHNVELAIENCPVMGNIAVSPYMYELLFREIPDPRLGWAYDPSHLLFQFCDVYSPVGEFADRIFHVHAKDTHINRERLARTGTLAEQSWWHYCLPGQGDIDWARLLQELKNAGYDGVISIEHEDPQYTGSVEKVTEGILLSKQYLEKVLAKIG